MSPVPGPRGGYVPITWAIWRMSAKMFALVEDKTCPNCQVDSGQSPKTQTLVETMFQLRNFPVFFLSFHKNTFNHRSADKATQSV